MSDEYEELSLNIDNLIDIIKLSLNESFEILEGILKADVKVLSLQNLIDFINSIIELIRGLINALLTSSDVISIFIQHVIDIVYNIIEIILNNKDIVEGIYLLIPAIPFIYILFSIVRRL